MQLETEIREEIKKLEGKGVIARKGVDVFLKEEEFKYAVGRGALKMSYIIERILQKAGHQLRSAAVEQLITELKDQYLTTKKSFGNHTPSLTRLA